MREVNDDVVCKMFCLLVESAVPVDTQVAEKTRFRTDRNIERAVKTYRNYVDGHLPAVQFAAYKHGNAFEFPGVEIKEDVSSHFPFRSEIEIATHVYTAGKFCFKATIVRLKGPVKTQRIIKA